MTENEAKFLEKLDELANDLEVDMYSVANLNFFFEESANTIRKLIGEIQQYRALEQKLQSVYGEHDGLLGIVVNGLVKYENAPDKPIKAVLLTDEDVDKWEQYKAIGTIEEFRTLKEKNEPYTPKEYEDRYYACKCGNPLLHKWDEYPTKLMPKSRGLSYCLNCGQKLDWN